MKDFPRFRDYLEECLAGAGIQSTANDFITNF